MKGVRARTTVSEFRNNVVQIENLFLKQKDVTTNQVARCTTREGCRSINHVLGAGRQGRARDCRWRQAAAGSPGVPSPRNPTTSPS